jgi:hypothetical protein
MTINLGSADEIRENDTSKSVQTGYYYKMNSRSYSTQSELFQCAFEVIDDLPAENIRLGMLSDCSKLSQLGNA